MAQPTKFVISALAIALAVTVLSATAVIAASRPDSGLVAHSVDEQTLLWRTGSENRAFTTSTKWTVLPLPSGGCIVGQNTCGQTVPSPFIVQAQGPISLTFSAVFSGGVVDLRFRDGQQVMRPGSLSFRPQGQGLNTFSFTFVSTRNANRVCEGPIMEWRSATGGTVQLNRATIVVHYKKYVPKQQTLCQ